VVACSFHLLARLPTEIDSMCLAEVISALRDRGIAAAPYRVHHAIACGRVPRPSQQSGRFVYGPKDVDALAAWLKSVSRGRPPKTTRRKAVIA
jgi:hypothetical protein